ncbi:hypothetical protein [uncultured Massilia sp.]|uniref:hypothetical protein n=1 Tax=uncultured Massilia sp. TaxID=169973 RepID=UPI00258DDE18|nr:hypothetical protein [uncultured Massilia sp.]
MELFRQGLRHLMLLLAISGAAMAQTVAPSGQEAGRAGGAQVRYEVVELLPGTIGSYPRINAAGQVAVSMVIGGRTKGFFYDGAALRQLGFPGGGAVYANGLNDAGQVAGTALNKAGVERAFVWSARGGMRDLAAGKDSGSSYGMAINGRGVVTGSFQGGTRPFRWSAAGGLQDLGSTPAPSGGRVLNDGGVIAGVSTIDDETTRVFAWTRERGLIDIDTLGSIESSPVAVGAGGEVAGNRLASWDDGGDRPFLWTQAGGMRDLGIGRGSTAWVNAMTPGLHIAGAIGYPDGRQRAMSWTRRGGMRELGALGGRTSVARAVNARGQIVGFAENGAGAMRAFVWSERNGMLDLNRLLRRTPPGLVLEQALAINDSGVIVASANTGLVLLKPSSL